MGDSHTSLTPSSAGLLARLAARCVGYDVFISYRHKDATEYAQQLHTLLQSRRLRVFLDRADHDAGGALKAFPEAAAASRTLVVIVSDNVYQSSSVLEELGSYYSRRVDKLSKRAFSRIIPINVDGALNEAPAEPKEWRRLQDFLFTAEIGAALRSGQPSKTVVDDVARSSLFLRSWVLFTVFVGVITATILGVALFGAWQVSGLQETSRILTAQNSTLASQTTDLQANIKTLETSASGLSKQVTDLIAEGQALNTQVEEAKDEIVKKAAEVRRQSRLVATLNGTVTDLKSQVFTTGQQLADTKLEVDTQTALAAEQRAIAEQETLKARVALLVQESDRLSQTDPTRSFRTAEKAFALDSNSLTAYAALLRSYYRKNRFYSVIAHRDDEIIRALEFSPDAQAIAGSWSGGSVVIWDLQGKVLAEWKHTGEASSVDFIDNDSVVSGGQDNVIRLWAREKPMGEITRPAPVSFASSLPNRKLFTVSGRNVEILDMTVANGSRVIDSLPKGALSAAVDKMNGRWAATAFRSDNGPDLFPFDHGGKSTVRIYDLTKPGIAHSIEIEGMATSLAFSMNDTLVCGSWSGKLELIDLQTGSRKTLRHQVAAISAVAARQDTNDLYVPLDEGTVSRLITDGREMEVYAGHTSALAAIARSANGPIATADGSDVRLWESEQRIAGTPLGGTRHVVDAYLSPTGNRILLQFADDQVSLVELPSRTSTEYNPGGRTGWRPIRASSVLDGQSIFFSTAGGSHLLNFSSATEIPLSSSLTGKIGEVREFLADGQLASVSADGKSLSIWNLQTGTEARQISLSREATDIKPASRNASRFVTISCGNSTCEAIAYENDKVLMRLPDLKLQDPVAISPDGKRIAWALDAGKLRIAELTGNTPQVVADGVNRSSHLSFSSDGRMLLSSDGGSAQLFDLEGRLLVNFEDLPNALVGPSFTADGNHLFLVDDFNTLWLLPLRADDILNYVNKTILSGRAGKN